MGFSTGIPIMVQEELSTAGPALLGRAQQISDQLQQLANYLNTLPESWTGRSSTTYTGLQAEWNTAANGLFGPDGVLGAIAGAMNVTWNNYTMAETTNTSTWQHG